MFDKWVGSKTNLGNTNAYFSFNIKNDGDIPFLKKWVKTNCSVSTRIPTIMKNEQSLTNILNVFLTSKNRHTLTNIANIDKILRLMIKLVIDDEFDKELFEMKVIEVSLVRKSLANNIAKHYPDLCKNYLAYKKL